MRAMRPARVRPPWRSSESWPLSRVDDRFDPLADAAQGAEAGCSSLRSGRRSWQPSEATSCSNSCAGEAFVGDHGLAGLQRPFEQFGGDVALGRVGGGELEADRDPVGGAEQVEAEAPEPAAVRAAVAVAAVAGELRSG